MAVAPVSSVPATGLPTPYADRRADLMRRLGPDAALVLASPPEHLRNGDTHFKFRQDSDILYLTGFEEPGAVVVVRPGHEKVRFAMFVRPRDPAEETWTGRRAGVEGAVRDFGADAAFVAAELDEKLAELLSGVQEIHYPFGREPALDAAVARLLGRLRAGERKGTRAPVRLVDARLTLHEMRLIKSPQEIAIQRRAAEITAEAHIAAMLAAKGAANEHEIEALVDYTFRKNGGTGPGYPTIVGSGDNATILHYVENRAPLVRGQLLLVDAGCEIDGYTADVTRTSPIGARFSPAQRRLYEAVLETQIAAIEAVKPGATLDAIHNQVVESLTHHMVALGLLAGEVPALIEAGAHKQFYMHRTSHWLGMDVHDVGFYSEGGVSRPLQPGMVLTIEPGLYVAADAKVPPEYRGLGVRIEDDILVTADGYDNLTISTPKSVADIEALTA
ncbi:MAG TPA: aminopeptidase P N-terminal domain-containing protein [Polyangia bacterium]|nr:aminopeptidase P N-terminal domain-containing protein [Polyangia bacterium]